MSSVNIILVVVTPKGIPRMIYLLNRNGRYYFNRKVPKDIQVYDCRPLVRIALKTHSKRAAIRLAMQENAKLEAYWDTLTREQNASGDQYKTALELSRDLGFSYLENKEISAQPLMKIFERLEYIAQNINSGKAIEAVLGGTAEPQIMLDELLKLFWQHSKDKTLNKTHDQIRKWQNPKIKAMNNLISLLGNKPLKELTRNDILILRDWWIGRIENENKSASSANKDFVNVKIIVETICENLKIKLDTSYIFKKILLKSDEEGKRLPFATDYIIATLLNPQNLDGLNNEAKAVLHAFAETGAGISELVGLLPEEIKINDAIPHICIFPHKGHSLKKKYRKRIIPLVGYALDAFKAFPQGFERYRGKPDSLSNYLNMHFREKKIMPSEEHSVYSLRHSFQDRLLAVNTPDRLQAELMGHKFQRPSYGEGGTLAHKLEFLEKIKLKR